MRMLHERIANELAELCSAWTAGGSRPHVGLYCVTCRDRHLAGRGVRITIAAGGNLYDDLQ